MADSVFIQRHQEGLEVVVAHMKYPTQLHGFECLVPAGGAVLGGCGASRMGGIAGGWRSYGVNLRGLWGV